MNSAIGLFDRTSPYKEELEMEYVVLVFVVIVVLYLFAGEMSGEEQLQKRIKKCFTRKDGKR